LSSFLGSRGHSIADALSGHGIDHVLLLHAGDLKFLASSHGRQSETASLVFRLG